MKLRVKNFIGLKEAEVSFTTPLSIVMGENAAGKTSLRDSIFACLGLTVREVKAKDKKILGDRWITELEGEDWKFKASSSQTPNAGSVADALGVSRKALPYCLDPDILRSKNPSDLKELLSEVLQLEFDWKQALRERLGDEYTDLINELIDSDIKKAAKYAATERASRKQTEGSPPEDVILREEPTVLRCSDDGILEKIENAIEKVQAELDSKLQKYGEITINITDEEKKELMEEMDGLRKSIDSAKDRRERYDEYLKKKNVLLKAVGDAELKLEQEASKLRNVETTTNILSQLKDIDFCEDCRKKVAFKTSFDQGAMEQIQKKVKTAEEALENATKAGNELKEVKPPQNSEELIRRLSQIENDIELADTPDEVRQELSKNIDDLRDRLKKGKEMRDKIIEYNARLEQHRKSEASNAANKEAWERWNTICHTLPELEKESIGSGIDPLREIISQQAILPGDVEIDEDLNITYHGRPMPMLSDTEKYRLCIVFQSAILELFQFPFCLIDRGDLIISDELKKSLTADLTRIAKIRPVIFIQAKRKADVENMKSSKFASYYWIENGTVKKL